MPLNVRAYKKINRLTHKQLCTDSQTGERMSTVDRRTNIIILCTIYLAISYICHLYVLTFVQYQTLSIAMTRTGS